MTIGDLLKLLDHILMVLDHHLGKLFHVGAIGLLLRKLAKFDFGLVICQKACR
jgi:hypothetical protein